MKIYVTHYAPFFKEEQLSKRGIVDVFSPVFFLKNFFTEIVSVLRNLNIIWYDLVLKSEARIEV